jgi:peptide/nickel transport system permease protein
VTRLIVRRLLVSIPLLGVVSFVTFVLVSLTPGNAAYTVLGSTATKAQLASLSRQMGLNKPLVDQYGTWLGHALQGNLGQSLITGQPVTQALGQQLGPTLSLVLLALLVTAVGGVLLGVWSAVRGGRLARLVDSVSFVGIAVPSFILAIFLISLFVLKVHAFPASGYVPISQSPVDWIRSLVLPVVALSFGGVGIVAKQTRAAMEDVLAREFVVVMRANGYTRRSIVYRHALKAAAVQVLSVLGVTFVGLLTGAVLIESIFSIPGLGGLAVQASSESDIPLVIGVTVTFTLMVVAANLLLDIAYLAVNPRIIHR